MALTLDSPERSVGWKAHICAYKISAIGLSDGGRKNWGKGGEEDVPVWEELESGLWRMK